MVEAQFDQLGPDEQQVLEAAAVAGVEFSAAAAAAALAGAAPAGPRRAGTRRAGTRRGPTRGRRPGRGAAGVVGVERACEALARRHRFLAAAGSAEWPDGTVATKYRFAHELYHNVVYGRVTAARRAGMHRAVAARLERAWGGRAAEAAAELAMHAEHGRDWPRAARHLRAAADAAGRQYAHREAVDYLRRAWPPSDRLPPGPEGDERLAADGAAAADVARDETFRSPAGSPPPEVSESTPARWPCAATRPPGRPARTFRVRGACGCSQGAVRPAAARAMAGELLDLAAAAADDGMVLQARQAMCVTALCLGDFAAAAAQAEAAAAIYDPAAHAANTHLFGQDPGVATQAFGSVAYQLLGRPADAARASARSLALVERLGQPSTRAVALHFAAMYHQCRGSPADAERFARAGVALAADEGFSFWHAGGFVLLGWARAAQGDATGVVTLRQGIDAWLATGSRTYHSYYLCLLADALVRTGRSAEAREVVAQATDVSAALHEGLSEGSWQGCKQCTWGNPCAASRRP
jgi:hypothetical protein